LSGLPTAVRQETGFWHAYRKQYGNEYPNLVAQQECNDECERDWTGGE